MPRDTIAYAEPLAPVDEDAKVLLRAITLIERCGHNATWSAFGPDGEICIGCAVSFAKANDFKWLHDYLDHISPRLGFKDEGEMIKWNVGRTAAEVIARLRAAAGRP